MRRATAISEWAWVAIAAAAATPGAACPDRACRAMPSALVTNAASWRLSIDQPTTLREKASNTTAQ
jgi:hypothetical protein